MGGPCPLLHPAGVAPVCPEGPGDNVLSLLRLWSVPLTSLLVAELMDWPRVSTPAPPQWSYTAMDDSALSMSMSVCGIDRSSVLTYCFTVKVVVVVWK